jgi:hypothetical protein
LRSVLDIKELLRDLAMDQVDLVEGLVLGLLLTQRREQGGSISSLGGLAGCRLSLLFYPWCKLGSSLELLDQLPETLRLLLLLDSGLHQLL